MSSTGSAAVMTPVCEECATAMHRVGTGDPQYWTCNWCGATEPVR